MATSRSHKVVYAALIANSVIAICKFVAAGLSGSAAMLSEGIHSGVDTGNELFLLLGMSRARRPATPTHPFGHGKELYFWSLLVALLIFMLGGLASIGEGVYHFLHPRNLSNPFWSYVVLAVAFVMEGYSFVVAFREFYRSKRAEAGLWEAVLVSKDPTIFTVMFEDGAALAGIVTAFVGLYLAKRLGNPGFDAAASIVIGLILVVVAVILVGESRGLIVGESLHPAAVAAIREVVEFDEDVEHLVDFLTMHLGPHEVLVNMDIKFRPGLTESGLVAAVDRLEGRIRALAPDVKRIFIEAEAISGRRGKVA